MAKAPLFVTKVIGDQVLAISERYGHTGAGYDEPVGRQERNEHAAAVSSGQNALITLKRLRGDPVFEPSIDEALAGGARLQEFADGEGAPELSVTIEITQSSVRLIKASKSDQIDSWVLENARAVAREPGRTVWRFDCYIVFRKPLTAETAASIAPSIALSLLSTGRVPLVAGRFDEVSGAIDFIDLTQPRVQCRAKLLETD